VQDGPKRCVSILLSLSFLVKFTQTSVFQVNLSYSSKVLFHSYSGSSSNIFHEGEDQDYISRR